MTVTEGCRCGAVRYTIALADLPLSYACHCRDCQTWSGSEFALHALLPDALLKIEGNCAHFRIGADEAMASDHIGCPSCMIRIANRNNAVPGMIVLRAGTLDRSDELFPAVHIWTSRRQPWIAIGDTPAFAGSPTPEQFSQLMAEGS